MMNNLETQEETSISNEGSQTELPGAEGVEETVATETAETVEATPKANQQTDNQSQGDDVGTTETSETETKASDDAQSETESETQAPEKYEFVSAEGSELDPAVIDTFSAVAQEAGLSQEKAQEMLDKVSPEISKSLEGRVNALVAKWADDAKADPLIGGNGDSVVLQKNLSIADRSVQAFGDQEYQSLLETTGLGNHPAVIRMHIKLGQHISEDSFVGSGSNVEGTAVANGGLKSEEDMAKTLYPKN